VALLDPHPLRLQNQIIRAVAGLSAEPLTRRPPGNWCAGEIGEHLYSTHTGTVKGFARVTAAGKRLATNQTWRQRGRRLMIVAFGYMPSGREAPPVARPRGLLAEKVLGEIGAKIAEMDLVLAPCEEELGRAADCWTILSSDLLGRHNGESFISCTACILSNRFDGCERRRSKSSDSETNRAPENNSDAPVLVVCCFYCWLGGFVWTGSLASVAEARTPALRASSC
jgi:hypothetical protein